jgi:arginase
MRISLIEVPYHYGFVGRDTGAGRGPRRYLEAGAERWLHQQGFEVCVQTIERKRETPETLAAVEEGNTALAAQVGRAVNAGEFPLVLSGGCNACLGVLAGLCVPVGIVWFDAHGDFNTPETTPSGFFDGMPLAVATGLCYPELWRRLASTPPVPPSHALLVGARDLDPGERDNIARSGLLFTSAAEIKGAGVEAALNPKLDVLRSRVEGIYLHLDIDVLDPEFAPGVDYRSPGGLSLSELEEAIGLIASRFRLRAASLTAYNPDHEQDDRTLESGLHLLTVAAAEGSTGP